MNIQAANFTKEDLIKAESAAREYLSSKNDLCSKQNYLEDLLPILVSRGEGTISDLFKDSIKSGFFNLAALCINPPKEFPLQSSSNSSHVFLQLDDGIEFYSLREISKAISDTDFRPSQEASIVLISAIKEIYRKSNYESAIYRSSIALMASSFVEDLIEIVDHKYSFKKPDANTLSIAVIKHFASEESLYLAANTLYKLFSEKDNENLVEDYDFLKSSIELVNEIDSSCVGFKKAFFNVIIKETIVDRHYGDIFFLAKFLSSDPSQINFEGLIDPDARFSALKNISKAFLDRNEFNSLVRGGDLDFLSAELTTKNQLDNFLSSGMQATDIKIKLVNKDIRVHIAAQAFSL